MNSPLSGRIFVIKNFVVDFLLVQGLSRFPINCFGFFFNGTFEVMFRAITLVVFFTESDFHQLSLNIWCHLYPPLNSEQ